MMKTKDAPAERLYLDLLEKHYFYLMFYFVLPNARKYLKLSQTMTITQISIPILFYL